MAAIVAWINPELQAPLASWYACSEMGLQGKMSWFGSGEGSEVGPVMPSLSGMRLVLGLWGDSCGKER